MLLKRRAHRIAPCDRGQSLGMVLPRVLCGICRGLLVRAEALQRAATERPNARLLLLRVFGSRRRSERFFDLLGARWRYAGSIQLIGGPDLATSSLDPGRFLDFLGRRLRQTFINTPDDLDQRLASMD